jgi:hypothetical protein
VSASRPGRRNYAVENVLVVNLLMPRHDLTVDWAVSYPTIRKDYPMPTRYISYMLLLINFIQTQGTTTDYTAQQNHDFQPELCRYLLYFDCFYPIAGRVLATGKWSIACPVFNDIFNFAHSLTIVSICRTMTLGT